MTAEVKKILVAVDESEYSKYALEWILTNLSLNANFTALFTQSESGGADHGVISFYVMHVQPLPNISTAGIGNPSAIAFGGTPPELVESIVNHQKQISEALLGRAKEICAQKNVNAKIVMEIGDPKEAICDAVEKMKVDLLIIGSHGYGMVKRALLGSVSNYCVQHAKCPVLVVRKPL